MRHALCSVSALLSLFVSMYLGLLILAAKGEEVFDGRSPDEIKVRWLAVLAVGFLFLALYLFIHVYRSLRAASRPNANS